MNSNKKLSEIKSFSKGKIREFINVAGQEILNQLELSHFRLHLDHYSYKNHGENLISIRLKDAEVNDIERLQQELENICYEKKLGMYPIVDEELMELQFFNKALNNHIKTYQLMKQDENQKVKGISSRILGSKGIYISDCIKELKQLISISDGIYLDIVNRLIDEDGGVLDDIWIGGLITKVTDKTIILDNAYFAKVFYEIDVDEDWEIVEIDNWGSDLKDITIEITD